MRCKACDSVLRDSEIFYDKKHETIEDLCSRCRRVVRSDILYLTDVLDTKDELDPESLRSIGAGVTMDT